MGLWRWEKYKKLPDILADRSYLREIWRNVEDPIKDIPEEAIDEIMNGTDERLQIKNDSLGTSNYFLSYEGVAKYILMQQESEASASAQKWAGQFIRNGYLSGNVTGSG